MKDLYRETGTIFRRSPLSSPEGEGFASRVRAVVADHARQLQGTLARVKREGGRFTQGTAGKKRTLLLGGVIVETWINPFGLTPTYMTRVYFPSGGEGFTEHLMRMETGWLTKDIFDVYTIYVWDDLVNLFALGKGAIDNVALESDKRGCFDMVSKPPPALGTDNEYETVFEDRFDPLSVYEPHRYSGLARLLMQGKRGANKGFWTDYEKLVGTGFSAGPGNLGVIRAPGGEYWLVHVASTGVLAVKLVKDPEMYCFDQISNGAILTGLSQNIIDAAVLAFTTVATRTEGEDVVADVIELLSAAEIRDVYRNEDDDLMEALVWGWVWKAQDRNEGAYDPGAVICTQLETGRIGNWRVHYKVSTLDFTFDDDGIPSATVTEVEAGKFMPPSASRLGTASTTSTLWRYVPPPATGDPYWARGVVAAWYTRDGTMRLIEYAGDQYSYSSTGISYAEWEEMARVLTVCGGGDSDGAGGSSEVSYEYPVWSISGVTADTFTGNSETTYSASLTSTPGTQVDFGFAVSPSQFQDCTGTQHNGYFWNDGRPYDETNVGWIESGGSVEYTTTVSTVQQSTPTRHVVLGESPGVVWWIENGQETTTTDFQQNCARGALTMGSGGLCSDPSGVGGEVTPSANSYTTATAQSGNCTSTTDEVVTGSTDVVGSVYIDSEENMTETEVNIVALAIAYQTVFSPESAQGLASVISYGNLAIAHAKDTPEGMSSVGYTKQGVWIGGA